jgi:hypothetical protein
MHLTTSVNLAVLARTNISTRDLTYVILALGLWPRSFFLSLISYLYCTVHLSIILLYFVSCRVLPTSSLLIPICFCVNGALHERKKLEDMQIINIKVGLSTLAP